MSRVILHADDGTWVVCSSRFVVHSPVHTLSTAKAGTEGKHVTTCTAPKRSYNDDGGPILVRGRRGCTTIFASLIVFVELITPVYSPH